MIARSLALKSQLHEPRFYSPIGWLLTHNLDELKDPWSSLSPLVIPPSWGKDSRGPRRRPGHHLRKRKPWKTSKPADGARKPEKNEDCLKQRNPDRKASNPATAAGGEWLHAVAYHQHNNRNSGLSVPNRKRFPCFDRVMVTRSKFGRTRFLRLVFPQQFRVLPNFHECYHNSMETQGKHFLLFLWNKSTKQFSMCPYSYGKSVLSQSERAYSILYIS